MARLQIRPRKGERSVPGLEAVGCEVEGLGHDVSEVDVRTEESVMHVSFEGGKAEREEIERAAREAGYEMSGEASGGRIPRQDPGVTGPVRAEPSAARRGDGHGGSGGAYAPRRRRSAA